jgi:hypothetical protein
MSSRMRRLVFFGRRRIVVASLVLGLLATLLIAVPASATGGRKWAPAVRVFAYTNDDGRPGHSDPGDLGNISSAYDRWALSSSDDPTAPGMDATRIDSDVARCKAWSINMETVRVRIQNAYPGYTCTFTFVTINKAGVKLMVDEINIDVDPTLELVELDTAAVGDHIKERRRLYATYAVTVLQEAPQGATLDFDIEIAYIEHRQRRPAPKCCHYCWR